MLSARPHLGKHFGCLTCVADISSPQCSVHLGGPYFSAPYSSGALVQCSPAGCKQKWPVSFLGWGI